MKKYDHIKTRLDERFQNINEGMYELYIPKDCMLKTLESHMNMLLCWGYLSDLRKGITNRKCGEYCEFSKNFNQKKFDKMMKKYEKANRRNKN